VTATTEFLATDILNKCGRASPARTVTTPEDPDDGLHLIGPPHEYLTPSHLQFINWPVA
jgi:hypothetical protein